MPIPCQTARSRLTATFVAAALALTSLAASATPARASDDAMIKLLLGAAAVAIIASGASKSRAQSHAPQHHHVKPRHYHPPRAHHPKPKHRARPLPQHCQASYRTGGKRYHAYSARCLHHAGMRRLPSACVVSTRSGNLYATHCLRRHGYS